MLSISGPWRCCNQSESFTAVANQKSSSPEIQHPAQEATNLTNGDPFSFKKSKWYHLKKPLWICEQLLAAMVSLVRTEHMWLLVTDSGFKALCCKLIPFSWLCFYSSSFFTLFYIVIGLCNGLSLVQHQSITPVSDDDGRSQTRHCIIRWW